MLNSTLLYVAIISDISSKSELSQGEIIKVAKIVAQEPEFSGNREIATIVADLRQSEKTLNKLRKWAHENNLKDLF